MYFLATVDLFQSNHGFSSAAGYVDPLTTPGRTFGVWELVAPPKQNDFQYDNSQKTCSLGWFLVDPLVHNSWHNLRYHSFIGKDDSPLLIWLGFLWIYGTMKPENSNCHQSCQTAPNFTNKQRSGLARLIGVWDRVVEFQLRLDCWQMLYFWCPHGHWVRWLGRCCIFKKI